MFSVLVLVSCFKLLLLPSYHSTDFEVHRNWLAITHNLPVKKWYFEETSEWTLDYPPLFAWFEYLLSMVAQFFDKDMLVLTNLNYESFETILFQRLSVICTDLVYAYGVRECVKSLPKIYQNNLFVPILLLCNIGLLMVDHIHFQYNGMLYGILLISIGKMMQENFLFSAFWFAFLINMKHIYIYLAPGYFVYLLKNYCFTTKKKKFTFSIKNFLKLAGLVSVVFAITFLPFHDHIPQVLSRLFPFKRGLCHAYWAPNVWAIYNVIDKVTIFILKKLNIPVIETTASMTGGLVQEFSHTVLPNITPLITIFLTGSFILPGMIKLWSLEKKHGNFIRFLVICALTSFLFGWHVHEKAILMAIIPLSILVVFNADDAKAFLILSSSGFYSLFPLLFPPNLTVLKALLFIIYIIYAFYNLCNIYSLKCRKNTLPLLNLLESFYVVGFAPLFIYENVLHPILGFNETLPFLPLMLTSVYCSLGVLYTWTICYIQFLYQTK